MPTTARALLPLARPPAGDRIGALHRRALALPPGVHEPTTLAVTAVAVLLHRYTGHTDLVIGRPARQELRLTVEADVTTALLHEQVGSAAAEPAGDEPCMAAVCPSGAAGPSPAPLTVLVGTAGLELVMPADQFDADAVDQYCRHLGRVLDAVAQDPAAVVDGIGLLDEEETRRALVDWNSTEEAVAAPFLHELVRGHARATPSAVAVALPGARVTYAELDAAAERLAGQLLARGVRPRDRVGVCFPRGADALVAQLACFKIAVGVILMDPDFPAERLRFMAEDAAAALVLTLSRFVELVSGPRPVLATDTDTDTDTAIEGRDASPVAVPVEVDDVIHVGYTSGSTGTPKAVLARFGAARNVVHAMRELCGMTAASQGTWLAAPGYGMIQVECFPVLAAGGTVHIPEAGVVASPLRLQRWMLDNRITTTLLMKPMAERLWGLEWPADTALRDIRVCGERIQAWPPEGLPFRLINLYGSTEATTVASCDITALGRALTERERVRRRPPIGRPIANVRTYVLGEDDRPAPPGVSGELCVTGDGLSAGYLDRPELTASRWVANPLRSDPIGTADHPVLYRTGDIARYWPDGTIEIIGRRDNQIKVRGNTVHLGEVEAVLADQPGVAKAAVLAHRDDHDVRLTAYVEPGVGPGGQPPRVADLRSALSRTLPAFMVPSTYVVGGLPISTNGKIDRAALPTPPRSRGEVSSSYQGARTAVERELTQLWTAALDVEDVGVADNFFELGGDSLRAAWLTERVCERFGIEVEVEDLFDGPSIERMAVHVQDATGRATAA